MATQTGDAVGDDRAKCEIKHAATTKAQVARATRPRYDTWGRRIRLKHPPELKERLVKEQDGLCHWCSRPFGQVPDDEEDRRPAAWLPTFEHLIRFKDGGVDGPPNLVVAHRKCNEDRNKTNPGNPPKWETRSNE